MPVTRLRRINVGIVPSAGPQEYTANTDLVADLDLGQTPTTVVENLDYIAVMNAAR